MITKYDANQYVLIRAKVDGVIMEKADKEPRYNLNMKLSGDFLWGKDINVTVSESEIVCGWIGGDGDDRRR